MRCISCEFHVYKSICKPRIGESLQMKPEYANPFDIAIPNRAKLCQAKVTKISPDKVSLSKFNKIF